MRLGVFLGFLLLSAGSFAWMDPLPFPQGNWQYRVPIAVSNNGSALTDYQVAVNTTNLVYNNSGLVGSWHFSEGAGTRFADSSGNGNDGTYNGETFNTGTLNNFGFVPGSGWADGKYGKALQFDGVNDYVDYGSTGIPIGNGARTVEAWVKSSASGAQIVVDAGAQAINQEFGLGYEIGGDTRGIWVDYWGGGCTSGVFGTSGQWNHIAATFDGSNVNIYLNGSLIKTCSGVTLSTGSTSRTIGTRIGNTWWFNGAIDEVRVYGRALSASEIQQTYQNNTFIRSGLAAYWRFDEGSGTTAYDTHHIATPDNAGGTKFGNALTFDGSNDYVNAGSSASLAFSSAVTLEAWINPQTFSGYAPVFGKSGDYSTKRAQFIWLANPASPQLYSTLNNNVCIQNSAAGSIPLNAWSHVAFTFDGATAKLYINGTQVSSVACAMTLADNSATPLTLGFDSNNIYYFAGTIDEARAYNRTLSAQEIAQHYSAGRLRPDYGDLRFTQPYTVYETPIAVSGTGTSLTDYQVLVNITNITILSHVKADGSDLRFFAAQTSSPYPQTGLPYWIESINSTQAKVWVKANVSSGGSTIYLYYGNPNATGASNKTAVFRTATGGSISYNGTYTVHTFSSNGTFTPFFTGDVNITVIGGGGSGSGSYVNGCGCVGSAGGSGGVNVGSVSLSSTSPVAVTVGAGGIGTGVACSVNPPGTTGGTSSFGTYMVATGGPGGGTGAPLGSPGGFAGGSAIGCLSHGEVGPGGGGTAGAGGSNYGGAGGGGNGYGGAGGYQSAGGFAGGGGSSGWSGIAGQNGANGIVVVTYTNRSIASPEPSATLGSESVKSAGNEALLNYWQESDSRVWVKAASVPAGASTIYAYYGNPNATGAGNGTATFDFFDDFDRDLSKWNITLGSPSVSGGVLTIIDAADMVSRTLISPPAIQTAKVKFISDVGQITMVDNPGISTIIMGNTPNQIGFYSHNADTIIGSEKSGVYSEASFGNYNDYGGNYHVWDEAWTGAQFKLYRDNSLLYTKADNIPTVPLYPAFASYRPSPQSQTKIESILVRKYASPEPSLSLQQEETPSPVALLGISPAGKTTYPNYPETFALNITNNQNLTDGFLLSCTGNCAYSENPVSLAANQTKTVSVTITAANISGTTAYTITAASQANASNSAGIFAYITVDATKWRDQWTDAYGNGFRYRVQIALNNTGSALTDYQVNITIDTSTPIGLNRMRGDCGDIRIMNGTNDIPFWVEGGCNTTSAKIWARVPYVPAGNSTIYVYYGNAAAANKSSGKSTFDGFWAWDNSSEDWVLTGGSGSGNAWFEPTAGNPPGDIVADCCNCGPVPWYISWNLPSMSYAVKFQTRSQVGYDGGLRFKVQNSAGAWTALSDECLYNTPWTWKGEFVYTGSVSKLQFEQYAANCGQGSNCFGEYRWVDNLIIRKYASPAPSVLSGAEQSKGYRALVRRCGLKQANANATAYYAVNSSYAGSCLTDANGICTLEIGAGMYNLLFSYQDNSTAWKNGTVFS